MLNRERMADVLEHMKQLSDGPWDVKELAKETGLSIVVTRDTLNCLEAAGEVTAKLVKTQTLAQKMSGKRYATPVAFYQLAATDLSHERRKLEELGVEAFCRSIHRKTGRTSRILRHAAVLTESGRTVAVVTRGGSIPYAKGILAKLGNTAVQVVRSGADRSGTNDIVIYDDYDE